MKRIIYITILSAAALAALVGCQKSIVTAGKANKVAFDAKVHVMKQLNPGYLWKQTPLGAYVLEWDQGTGRPLSDTAKLPYILASFTTYTTDGIVKNTSERKIAQQVGTFSEKNYYGSYVWFRGNQNLYAGLEESLLNLSEGGYLKVLIPGWLATNNRYKTAEEYLEKETGEDVIYYLKVESGMPDVKKWEIDSLIRFIGKTYPEIDPADTVEATTTTRNRFGFYYKQLVPPTADTTYMENNSIYVRYVGRLLNGKVFDTNIADTAKAYKIYDSSNKYAPMEVKWKENVKDMKMVDNTNAEESSLIDGMNYALWHMKEHEKGVCMFYSGHGYGYEGTESVIPPYCPLMFEIELVDEP